MELINELNEDYWSRGDPTQTAGYERYRLMKCEKLDQPGSFLYGVFDDNGTLKKVTLQNGASSRDPLVGIGNLLLRLSDDGKQIVGVIVEDDCVTLKTNANDPAPVANGGSDVIGDVVGGGVAAEGHVMDGDVESGIERPAVSDTVNGDPHSGDT